MSAQNLGTFLTQREPQVKAKKSIMDGSPGLGSGNGKRFPFYRLQVQIPIRDTLWLFFTFVAKEFLRLKRSKIDEMRGRGAFLKEVTL